MRRTLVPALALVAFACAKEPAPQQTVAFLYYGGTIVTRAAETAGTEAVAVKDGRVVDMGTFDQMHDAHAGALTRMIDLKGGVMVPGAVEPSQADDVSGVLSALGSGAQSRRTIAIGEPADFVVFNRDPADSAATDALAVVKIVRGGETVFRATR